MSQSYLKKLILEGEGENLDFKKTISDPRKIAKTLVAFANRSGGKLLVGILDDGTIKGIKFEDEEKYQLYLAAQNYCIPPIPINIIEHPIDDRIVLEVIVLEGVEKPFYALDDQNKKWVYVRVKDKSILASSILVEVMKKNKPEMPNIIEFNEQQKNLLTLLDTNKKFTFREVSEALQLNRRKSTQVLVRLILAGIIRVDFQNNEETYYLA